MPLFFVPPSTPGAFPSTVVLTRFFVAGVNAGDFVYETGVASQVDRTNASAFATGRALGLCTAINNPAVGLCQVLTCGDSGALFVGLTPGAHYVLSTALGGILLETAIVDPNYPNTAPGSGHVLQVVGKAKSATEFTVQVGAPTVF